MLERLCLAIFLLSIAAQPLSASYSVSEECTRVCGGSEELVGDMIIGTNSECERGCRFFIIGRIIALNESSETVLETCKESCLEAYGPSSLEATSCANGCDAEAKAAEVNVTEEKPSEESEIHLLQPIMQFRKIYNTILENMLIVKTSVVTYFLSDDDNIVVMESRPEIMIEMFGETTPEEDSAAKSVDVKPVMAEPRNLFLGESSCSERGGGVTSRVNCASHRLGVPRELLLVTMALTLVFTVYVLWLLVKLVSTRHQKKVLASSAGLSIQADPVMPVKVVRPEDLTRLSFCDDLEEAAPLPIKGPLPQDLPQTKI